MTDVTNTARSADQTVTELSPGPRPSRPAQAPWAISSDQSSKNETFDVSGDDSSSPTLGGSVEDALTQLRSERSDLLRTRRLKGLTEVQVLLLGEVEKAINRLQGPRIEQMKQRDAETFDRVHLALRALLAAK